MSVVIDEFEVVPAPEGGREEPTAPEERRQEEKKRSADAELERLLKLRAERTARLEAD
jgi:hypothetical protein